MSFKKFFILTLILFIFMMMLATNSDIKGAQKEVNVEQKEWLAHLIYNEAGSQGRQTMLYVGSVVLNRVRSDRFPNTICGVIHQKGQYSTAHDARTPSEESYEIAEELLLNGSVLPSKVLFQHWKRPVKGTTEYCHIGNEYFSYSKEVE